jgi:hypothetical protein
MVLGFNPVLIGAVSGALLLFGFGYNALVAWLERCGYDEGYTSFLVVGGVLGTLGLLALLEWYAALLALWAFSCSGFAMVLGSWWRHVRAREAGQEAQREEVD